MTHSLAQAQGRSVTSPPSYTVDYPVIMAYGKACTARPSKCILSFVFPRAKSPSLDGFRMQTDLVAEVREDWILEDA